MGSCSCEMANSKFDPQGRTAADAWAIAPSSAADARAVAPAEGDEAGVAAVIVRGEEGDELVHLTRVTMGTCHVSPR